MSFLDLEDKTFCVIGVANRKSIAYHIAKELEDEGASVVHIVRSVARRESLRKLLGENAEIHVCDVEHEDQIEAVRRAIASRHSVLHGMVHSVAFAPREELQGEFRKTSREGWQIALEISAYSLVDLANRATPLMEQDGGSILALSYVASQRVVPKYNVMGSAKAALEHGVRQLAFELGGRNIRVNCISAGPISTLSARAVSGFTGILGHYREHAPLKRSVEAREVADAALFLCSDLASGITGETLYVDGGYNIMAV